MGLVKEEWIEAQERGWTHLATHVCGNCIEDGYLKELIQLNLTARKCDYCGRSDGSAIAACADVVLEAVFRTVDAYYCEPAAGGMPYDHGFVIEPVDIRDVFDALGVEGHPDLIDAMAHAEANGDVYVPAARGHWASMHDHDTMNFAWATFAHAVMHETRFHFSVVASPPRSAEREIGVAEMLPILGKRLILLVRRLPANTCIYRARERKRGEHWKPIPPELGAPPPERATAGRMNPAGILYLYASFDARTAMAEIRPSQRALGVTFLAEFALSHDLDVIDLTSLPMAPSIFDIGQKPEREAVLFLGDFVAAISARVAKDEKEHVEYVPSQVVCEYLAQVFTSERGQRLAGLMYPSAVSQGGRNLVVFPCEDHLGRTFHGVELIEVEARRPLGRCKSHRSHVCRPDRRAL